DSLAGSRGCSQNGCRGRFAVTTTEQGDRVLRFYDGQNANIAETGHATADELVVVGDRAVAFRQPEDATPSHGGGDLNQDGDRNDKVMHVVVFDDGIAGPLRILNTGYSALGLEGPYARLGWRTPYLVTNDYVLFLVRESDQQEDLNHDGVIDDTIVV